MDTFDHVFMLIANASLTLINILLIRHSAKMSEMHADLIQRKLSEMYGQDK